MTHSRCIFLGQNSWSGGEHIEPMTPNAAREWAEKNLGTDEYAAEFGEPEEAADGREALGLTVSPETKRKLEKMRSETGKKHFGDHRRDCRRDLNTKQRPRVIPGRCSIHNYS